MKCTALFLLLLVSQLCPQKAYPQNCACGPDFCLNDSRYPAKLAAKKAAMVRDGYPANLIALLDRDGACVACVDRAPDIFTIKLIYPDSTRTIPWTGQDENLARTELLNGTLRSYHKFNVSRAFSCCGQPRYDQRPDWDATLELNKQLAISCTKSGSSVVCN